MCFGGDDNETKPLGVSKEVGKRSVLVQGTGSSGEDKLRHGISLGSKVNSLHGIAFRRVHKVFFRPLEGKDVAGEGWDRENGEAEENRRKRVKTPAARERKSRLRMNGATGGGMVSREPKVGKFERDSRCLVVGRGELRPPPNMVVIFCTCCCCCLSVGIGDGRCSQTQACIVMRMKWEVCYTSGGGVVTGETSQGGCSAVLVLNPLNEIQKKTGDKGTRAGLLRHSASKDGCLAISSRSY